MKVLLSHGYYLHEDETENKVMMPYPPQGLLHIAAYLENNGMPCTVYDSTFSSFDRFCSFLETGQPQYLGLYVNLMTRPNILRIIDFVKKSEKYGSVNVILGGPDVKHHKEKYLEKGADYCITGEGEEAFFHLVTALEKGGQVEFPGISWRDGDNEIHTTGDPVLVDDIDTLPFPDFDMINIEEYFKTWKEHHGYTSLTVSTMRGCPYTCRWCSKAVFGGTYRRRSPLPVVRELSHLLEKYAPERFWMVDDVFTISKEWLREFAEALKKSGTRIRYECISRADRLDMETMELLRHTGCFRLWIGAESGSQDVLDLMDRRVDARQVRDVIKMAREAGMEAGTFLMLGYPGETEKDILETAEHLKEALPDLFTITMTYPIPGTELYTEVEKAGIRVPGEWGCYTDREIEYERPYSTRYYGHAIRFIHHYVMSERTRTEGKTIRSLKHAAIARLSQTLMRLTR